MASDLLDRVRLGGGVPSHIAVIMDGNGRWARERGLPRHLGHREGMNSVREVVEGAVEAGVDILTLFAFSTENWKRPAQEVTALMGLLQLYARKERAELRRLAVDLFGDVELLAHFLPGIIVGQGWETVSGQLLYVVASMESAEAEMTAGNIDIRGVTANPLETHIQIKSEEGRKTEHRARHSLGQAISGHELF